MTLAAWAAASSSAGWNVAGRSTPARPAASYWKRLAWIGSISSRGPNGSRSDVGADRLTATRYSSWVGKATAPCGSASQISAEQRGELVGPLVRVRADDRRREPRSQAERLAAVIHARSPARPAPRASGSPRARSRTSTRARSPPAATRSRPARDGSGSVRESGLTAGVLTRSTSALCRTRLPGAAGAPRYTLRRVRALQDDRCARGRSGWSGPLGGLVRAPFRRRCPARHEGLEGVVQHGQGPGRDPGGGRRRRLARPARVRHRRLVARHGRPRAGGRPGRRGPGRDRVARGARRGVLARGRRLPARPLRRSHAPAAAPGGRPHGPRHRDGAAKGARRRRRPDPRPHRPRRPRAHERSLSGRARTGWRAPSTSTPGP